jgi:rod shape-determining protein MreC
MSLNTLENQAPPMFRQGSSATSRLLVYCALAIFLMVADKRFAITEVLRSALITVMTPVQMVAMIPIRALQGSDKYLDDLASARKAQAKAESQLLKSTVRSDQVELLQRENAHLRTLMGMAAKPEMRTQAAEVLYDVQDPYSRKVMVSKGSLAGVVRGSPVISVGGVLGQVTRVHPQISEVTLLTHREQATPVLNVRTGLRSVAYGVTLSNQTDWMELRFVAANADIAVGDVLTTSGVDGIYPGGLAVAVIQKIDRQADAGFARVYCRPLANPMGVQQVLLVTPLADQLPPRVPEEVVEKTNRKKAVTK